MTITLNIKNDIAVLKMDDGKVNAFTPERFQDILFRLDEVQSAAPSALIIIGRDGIFSGGLNVKWIPTASADERQKLMTNFETCMDRVFNFPIPTIAAVSGHAIAGGCILSCACDIRLAINGPFKFAMNEVFIGMAAPVWAQRIVRDAITVPHINTVMLHGEDISIDRAAAISLVHETADTYDQLLSKALEYGERFKTIGADSYRRTKYIHRSLHCTSSEVIEEVPLKYAKASNTVSV